ncbi:MlaD family protein [bacterium BMS3Abin03]|jgi:phospholipid/cholesterol/gamma-HCH transport system substrate-binding protein|nr:MlaD family protein [bacterium BMS3Abin03]MCG6958583.1 MlaD family protein [bacterium BMS3Abin03]
MANNLSGAKLGIFIFLGSVLLIVGIFVLGNKEALFKSTFTVKAFFQNVEGLRDGAPVRLSGVDVGAVKSIRIIGDQASTIEVSMRLLSDVARFIRKDTEAGIETEGLVGYKFVALYIKESEAEHVEDGGTILAKEPVSFADVIEETQGIMSYTKEMTQNLSEIVSKINRGEGTLGKILNDDALYYTTTVLTKSASISLDSITSDLRNVVAVFKNLGGGLNEAVTKINRTVENVDSVIVNVKEGKGALGSLLAEGNSDDTAITAIINDIREITREGKLAAGKLNENMEALKHNWLFKSYFEDRGYWDAPQYENEIDKKTKELNEKIQILEDKINELKSLDENQQ